MLIETHYALKFYKLFKLLSGEYACLMVWRALIVVLKNDY